jgi:TolB protein
VIDTAGGKARKLVNFIPTRVQSVAYEVFDQYALSHRIWSPDSNALVFAGVLVKEGATPPARAMPPPSIWLLPVDGATPEGISDGSVAFWSPAP